MKFIKNDSPKLLVKSTGDVRAIVLVVGKKSRVVKNVRICHQNNWSICPYIRKNCSRISQYIVKLLTRTLANFIIRPFPNFSSRSSFHNMTQTSFADKLFGSFPLLLDSSISWRNIDSTLSWI